MLLKFEPSLADTVSFREFQEGMILAALRAYDIVFDDGLTR